MKTKTWTRLDQVLQQNQQYTEARKEKIHETLTKVERVVNRVFSFLQHKEPRFGFDNMSPCSLYEVKSAKEIDLLCTLKCLEPTQVVLNENKVPSGCAKVRLANEAAFATWQDFCGRAASGEACISAEKLVSELAKELQSAVGNILQEGFRSDVANLTAHSSGRQATLTVVLRNGDEIKVNLIPVIHMRGLWPLAAHDFRKKLRHLPPAERLSVEECGVLLVAKPVHSCSEFLWRLWFSTAERLLLSAQKPRCTAICMRILSNLHQAHLSHAKFLTRYHLQTLVLTEYLEHPAARDWVQEKLPQRIMGLLTALKRMLNQQSCPHVFLNDVNLFPCCDTAMTKVLEKKVSAIIKDPFSFLYPSGISTKGDERLSITCKLPVNTSPSRVQISINLQSS